MASEAMELSAFGALRRPELDGTMTKAWELPSGQILYVARGGRAMMRRTQTGIEISVEAAQEHG